MDLGDIVTYGTDPICTQGTVFLRTAVRLRFADKKLIKNAVSVHTSSLYYFSSIHKHHRLYFDPC